MLLVAGGGQDCTDMSTDSQRTLRVPKILIVEDSPDNMKLFRTLLALKGHEVTGLSGGEGLLQTIERRSPDLVLMDIQLPGKDGFALLQEIRASRLRRCPGGRADGARHEPAIASGHCRPASTATSPSRSTFGLSRSRSAARCRGAARGVIGSAARTEAAAVSEEPA